MTAPNLDGGSVKATRYLSGGEISLASSERGVMCLFIEERCPVQEVDLFKKQLAVRNLNAISALPSSYGQ